MIEADHNEILRTAWKQFCRELESAADIVFRDDVPDTELDRATGVRYIGRYITKALDRHMEYNDPLHPQLYVLQTPTNKTFGDNPDCTYWQAWLDGTQNYRLVGNRGGVHWVRFVAVGNDGPMSIIRDEELVTEWDGSFTITIGPDGDGPNHMRTEPGEVRFFVRQFFGRWDAEVPMTGQIELVGDPVPQAPLTARFVADALGDAAAFIKTDSLRWFGYIEYFREWPNQFVAGSPPWAAPARNTTKMQMDSGRWVHFCYYDIAPDEVLLLHVDPPECRHWITELGNVWMNSTDYRYHLSSINREQAVAAADGSYYVAVCSDDPGIANWLDPAGHRNGLLINRWVDAEENPLPSATIVKRAELDAALPIDLPRITPRERREQLRRRKAGVERRFPIG